MFADLSERTYEQEQHNAWHEVEVAPEALQFYGAARACPHNAFLQQHPPRGENRLLDVGCGLGFFLARAAEAGWDVMGCEPSSPWAARAQARVGPDRVLIGRADHVALNHERFDLVTVWDVLEHVFDPLPLLGRLRSLLAPHGRLFIRTPNLAYVLPLYAVRRRVLRHAVELGPTNHVVYFTASTLSHTLEMALLRPMDWGNFPPPQVTTDRHSNVRLVGRREVVTTLKNQYASAAAVLARASKGTIVLSSDLDVLAAPA